MYSALLYSSPFFFSKVKYHLEATKARLSLYSLRTYEYFSHLGFGEEPGRLFVSIFTPFYIFLCKKKKKKKLNQEVHCLNYLTDLIGCHRLTVTSNLTDGGDVSVGHAQWLTTVRRQANKDKWRWEEGGGGGGGRGDSLHLKLPLSLSISVHCNDRLRGRHANGLWQVLLKKESFSLIPPASQSPFKCLDGLT